MLPIPYEYTTYEFVWIMVDGFLTMSQTFSNTHLTHHQPYIHHTHAVKLCKFCATKPILNHQQNTHTHPDKESEEDRKS